MHRPFTGVGVALVTPFHSNKSIDFDSLAAIIDYCITGGVDFLVSLGTTGETATLSIQEQLEVLDFTRNHISKRVPLVVGMGGNNTAELIERIQAFNLNGVDAILSASPSYNKPTQDGIIAHYEAIASKTELPIIVYNVPSRTGSNIEARTTLELAETIPTVIAVKEASGDLNQCMDIVQHCSENFTLLSGDDLLTLPLMASGFHGVISVVANAVPSTFTQLVHNAMEGEYEQAQIFHYALKDIMQLIFTEGNPAGVKALLSIQGLCEPHTRLPLVPASARLTKSLENAWLVFQKTDLLKEV